jgi:Zn-dependent peptidase ImmA (M78 family)
MPMTVSPSIGQIIAKYQASAPVNVVGIANELGIKVWEKESLNPPVSGMIYLDKINGGKSGFSIIVRKGDSLERKRFTVAHEIAHFILHKDKASGGITDDAMYRSGLSTREEAEANRLAADILMPYKLIRSLVSEGYKSMPALAEKLGVSKTAMSIRLNIPT